MKGLSEILIFIAGIVYGPVLRAVIGILESGISGVLAETFTFLKLILIVCIIFAASTFIGHLLRRFKKRTLDYTKPVSMKKEAE
jgi:type III secretory pathway component EscS